MKKINYEFENVKKGVEQLAKSIKKSRFKPKTLVALARGGLLIGLWLSHKLKIPLMIISMKSYDAKKNRSNTILLSTSHTVPLQSPVLIVDEICDSGLTLQTIKNHFEAIGVIVKTATLLYKPHAVTTPDWFVKQSRGDFRSER